MLPGTAVAPAITVNVVPETPMTASLNCAVTGIVSKTPVAPGAGVRVVTIGAVVSGAVVNVQVTGAAASGLPARSVMPEVSVAVITLLPGSCVAGVNVAVRVAVA